jgi:hypothetical protein
MVFLISSMLATINLKILLTNIPYPRVCLLLVCQDFAWQHILLRFDATLLDSSESQLHYYIFRHDLDVISTSFWTLNEIDFQEIQAP